MVDLRHVCGLLLRVVTMFARKPAFFQLFLSNEMLTGKVRITPPPGRTVWQGGVSAKLESVISTCMARVVACWHCPETCVC
jgi:hypothetical protein